MMPIPDGFDGFADRCTGLGFVPVGSPARAPEAVFKCKGCARCMPVPRHPTMVMRPESIRVEICRACGGFLQVWIADVPANTFKVKPTSLVIYLPTSRNPEAYAGGCECEGHVKLVENRWCDS